MDILNISEAERFVNELAAHVHLTAIATHRDPDIQNFSWIITGNDPNFPIARITYSHSNNQVRIHESSREYVLKIRGFPVQDYSFSQISLIGSHVSGSQTYLKR